MIWARKQIEINWQYRTWASSIEQPGLLVMMPEPSAYRQPEDKW